jgi:hypothetical protein
MSLMRFIHRVQMTCFKIWLLKDTRRELVLVSSSKMFAIIYYWNMIKNERFVTEMNKRNNSFIVCYNPVNRTGVHFVRETIGMR